MPKWTKKAATKKEEAVTAKKLYRSDEDKVIAGVAGGLGEYFGFDPTIIRIIFIILAVYGGSGVFIYLILWLFIPKKSQNYGEVNKTIRQNADEIKNTARNFAHKNDSRILVGIFLLFFGLLFLLDNFAIVNIGSVWRFWPILLIIGGYLILVRHGDR